MLKKITSPTGEKILKSLQYQGRQNDCGPYTTATVINALRGLEIDAAWLAEEMTRIAWWGPIPVVRRLRGSATFPWGMVDVFRRNGLRAAWRFFASQNYLRQHLNRDRVLMPIIGGWRPSWAHVMSLVAWDAERGWGFANTQYDHHEITWLDDATFTRQWRAMANLLVEVKFPKAQ